MPQMISEKQSNTETIYSPADDLSVEVPAGSPPEAKETAMRSALAGRYPHYVGAEILEKQENDRKALETPSVNAPGEAISGPDDALDTPKIGSPNQNQLEPKKPGIGDAAKQGAMGGLPSFFQGVGVMMGDTPVGRGIREGVLRQIVETGGTQFVQAGRLIQDLGNEDFATRFEKLRAEPLGLIEMAANGGLIKTLTAGLTEPIRALGKHTDIDFEIQKLGFEIKDWAKGQIEKQGIDAAKEKQGMDKILHDLGSGSVSLATSLGLALIPGVGTTGSALFMGLVQDAQFYDEETRTANVLDLTTGQETQVDHEFIKEQFERDMSEVGYKNGILSKDRRYQMSRAPLSASQARVNSFIAAIPEVVIEKIGLDFWMNAVKGKFIKGVISKVLSKASKPVRKGAAIAIAGATAGAGEAVEEMGQQGSEEALAKMMHDRPGTAGEIVGRVAYAGFLGMILGQGAGGFHAAISMQGRYGELVASGKYTSEEAEKQIVFEKFVVKEVGAENIIIASQEEAREFLKDIRTGQSDEEMKMQMKESPEWFSSAEKLIQEKMPTKARPDQVMGILSTAKKEELENTGIEEFLKGKEVVTKQEVLDHLVENRVQLKEVVKEEGEPPELSLEKQERFEYLLDLERDAEITNIEQEELDEMRNEEDQQTPEMTKFKQYQLPGGENYREVLLTLPVKPSMAYEQWKELYDKRFPGSVADEATIKQMWQRGETIPESGEFVSTREGFQSPHWDEANVLAHFRLNDRTVNGKKTLFIEEIQSDWHQNGRESGYRDDEKLKANYEVVKVKVRDMKEQDLLTFGSPEEYVRRTNSFDLPGRKFDDVSLDSEVFIIRDKSDEKGMGLGISLTEQGAKDMISERVNEIQKRNSGLVPNAPFKKTWHELALKKILRMAVEGGYDAIAWTTGEQQAERYDLSQVINEISWVKGDFENTKAITIKEKGRTKPSFFEADKEGKIIDTSDRESEFIGKNISEVIGKELSKSIAEKQSGSLKGLDLKVGGEGMKGFYDQMIPAFLNKYTKKWGGRVGEGKVETAPAPYPSEDAPMNRPVKVHTLEITPSMRDSVLAGQPMFQKKDGAKPEEVRDNLAAFYSVLKQWFDLKQLIPLNFRLILADAAGRDFRGFADSARRIIVILADANNETAPHEAFHEIFAKMLTKEQRAAMLKEVETKHKITDPILGEEKLAEMFAKAWNDRQAATRTLKGKVMQGLRDLAVFLRMAQGNAEAIEGTFNSLMSGDYVGANGWMGRIARNIFGAGYSLLEPRDLAGLRDMTEAELRELIAYQRSLNNVKFQKITNDDKSDLGQFSYYLDQGVRAAYEEVESGNDEGEASGFIEQAEPFAKKLNLEIQWDDSFNTYEVYTKEKNIKKAQATLVALTDKFGFKLNANEDGTITLFHGTANKKDYKEILKNGIGREGGLFVSPSTDENYGGVNGASYYGENIVEIDADPRKLTFRTEGEFFLSDAGAKAIRPFSDSSVRFQKKDYPRTSDDESLSKTAYEIKSLFRKDGQIKTSAGQRGVLRKIVSEMDDAGLEILRMGFLKDRGLKGPSFFIVQEAIARERNMRAEKEIKPGAQEQMEFDFRAELDKTAKANYASNEDEFRKAYETYDKYQEALEEVVEKAYAAGRSISGKSGRDRGFRSLQATALKQVGAWLKKHHYVPPQGLVANSPQDYAEIASVFRNPRIEIFQAIYSKGGEVLSHSAWSMNIPGFMFVPPKMIKAIKDEAVRLGADSVHIAHNHPSGNPAPSGEEGDLGLTKKALAPILGDLFKGHIVTNHDSFCVIAKNGAVDTYRFAKEKPKFKRDGNVDFVNSAAAAALTAKEYFNPEKATVIFLGPGRVVYAIANMNPGKDLSKNIARKMRALATDSYIVVIPEFLLHDSNGVARPDSARVWVVNNSLPDSEIEKYNRGLMDVVTFDQYGGHKSWREDFVHDKRILKTPFMPQSTPFEDTRILEDSPMYDELRFQSKQTETPEFKKWFGDSKVVDENGNPLVVYHGTTHNFTEFNNARGNAEGHYGLSFYFTDSKEDVSENYAGEGPDLTVRISRRAEILFDNMFADAPPKYDSKEYKKAMRKAEKQARAELSGAAPVVIPAFVSLKRPVEIKNKGGTFFEYDSAYDEKTDEYGEPEGSGVTLLEAVETVADDYDGIGVQALIGELQEKMFDGGIYAKDFEKIVRESDNSSMASDGEGNAVVGDFIAAIYKEAGYDGVIQDADSEFGSGRKMGKSMKMDYRTKHYIAFDPTQIKSAIGNIGSFDAGNPDIRFQAKPKRVREVNQERVAVKQEIDQLVDAEVQFLKEAYGDLVGGQLQKEYLQGSESSTEEYRLYRQALPKEIKHPITGNKPINPTQWRATALRNLENGMSQYAEEYEDVARALDMLNDQLREAAALEAQEAAAFQAQMTEEELDQAKKEAKADEKRFYKQLTLWDDAGDIEAVNVPNYVEGIDFSKTRDITGIERNYKDVYRIFRKVFGKQGKAVEEGVLDTLDTSVAKFYSLQKRLTDEVYEEIVQKLGIKKGSRESALVMLWGERQIEDEQEIVREVGRPMADNIIRADKWFRAKYDQLIEAVNIARKEIYPNNPDKLVKFRRDYYRHFREMSGIQGIFNIFDTPANISPGLVGVTRGVRPRSKWASFMQRRLGYRSEIDAVGGFLDYIPAVSYSILVDPNITVFRALAKQVAEATSETANLNEFIKFLHDYANDLAGKTGWADRIIVDLLGDTRGRKILRGLNFLNSRAKANVILGNISSTIAQAFNIPQAVGRFKLHAVGAFGDSMVGAFNGFENQKDSQFLKNRYADSGLDRFDETILKQPKRFAKWLLMFSDEVATRYIWNGFYRQAVARKVADPVMYADKATRGAVAGRAVGEVPLIQKARMFQLFAPFQLEVTNLWWALGGMFRDKDFMGVLIFSLVVHLMNAIAEPIRGSRVAFDPILALMEAMRPGLKWYQRVGRIAGEIVSNLPHGSQFLGAYDVLRPALNPLFEQFGGVKAPTRKQLFGSEAVRFSNSMLLTSALRDPLWNLAFPFAGKQIQKTVRGTKAVAEGFLDVGRTGAESIAIDPTALKMAQAALFGPYSLEEVRQYFDDKSRRLEAIDDDD